MKFFALVSTTYLKNANFDFIFFLFTCKKKGGGSKRESERENENIMVRISMPLYAHMNEYILTEPTREKPKQNNYRQLH